MKLSKKEPWKPQYKQQDKPVEYKKAPPVDWSRYEEDLSAEIPHGKYHKSALGYVKRTDDWYYNWMREQNLLGAWGLVKLRGEPERKKYSHHVTPEGRVWVDIQEVEGQGTPANKDWYEDNNV